MADVEIAISQSLVDKIFSDFGNHIVLMDHDYGDIKAEELDNKSGDDKPMDLSSRDMRKVVDWATEKG